MTIESLNSSTVYKQFVIDWLHLRMATQHEKKKTYMDINVDLVGPQTQ